MKQIGIGTEVFTMPGSKFRAVCINPVEDPEKIREVSERYWNGLISALEKQFGECWATAIINNDEYLEKMGYEGEELERIKSRRKGRKNNIT